MDSSNKIINMLPYGPDFCFVDNIISVDEHWIEANYTFRENHTFYRDHFIDNPVTPGVILTECMAQIALVCHGIYLQNHEMNEGRSFFVLTSSKIDFSSSVYPGETVVVKSEKIMYKMGMLRSKVSLYKADDTLAANGQLGGFLKKGI